MKRSLSESKLDGEADPKRAAVDPSADSSAALPVSAAAASVTATKKESTGMSAVEEDENEEAVVLSVTDDGKKSAAPETSPVPLEEAESVMAFSSTVNDQGDEGKKPEEKQGNTTASTKSDSAGKPGSSTAGEKQPADDTSKSEPPAEGTSACVKEENSSAATSDETNKSTDAAKATKKPAKSGATAPKAKGDKEVISAAIPGNKSAGAGVSPVVGGVHQSGLAAGLMQQANALSNVPGFGTGVTTTLLPGGKLQMSIGLPRGLPGRGLPGGVQGKQLGVEDALAYLDKVKRQFHDKPEVYNQFLEIMKNFKSQTIDTPGVINHVCELFKGHDNLILGFNTFLPPGFKIELPSRAIGPTIGGRPILTGLPLGMGNILTGVQNAASQNTARGGAKSSRSRAKGAGGKKAVLEAGPPLEDTAGNASSQGQPIEFDHAINYVTKIKKRFSTETETYKSFLDILHSYQNEQRSIKEVLEQVSNLFKDHADLLKEFTYFLPDAVRESAKTELVKRAAKAQKASQRAKQAAARRRDRKSTPMAEPDHNENRVPLLERNLLGRIKAALGARELWGEFLKCLDLFAQELISRSELLSLTSDIFGERADLLEEFDRLLASRGATDDPVESAWFSMPLADIDFSNCRRSTPSYRGLPAAYPKAPCSERTAMCRSVLNDTWVSVPLGSEDSSSKGHRRNQFEEALFKCEDDRYEIDMVIDSNKAAIRALEPLAKEIKALCLQNGTSSKFRYRLERRTLNVIHLKAIARIYGDHGTEILELLHRNPAGAIPVILRRLKDKDDEWCKDREELNKGWKEVMEKNYMKSLDHRSFYFKQAEKRVYSHKVFVNELKEKNKVSNSNETENSSGSSTGGPNQCLANRDGSTKRFVDMWLNFSDPTLHQDVWSIVALKIAKNCEPREAEKIAAFYAYFIQPLFNMPKKWLKDGQTVLSALDITDQDDDSKNPKTREEAFAALTKVETPFGNGVVQDYDVERGFYSIKYSYGTGYIRPACVTPCFNMLKPVVMEDADAITDASLEAMDDAASVFTTMGAYVFLRQYHLLFDRMAKAKELCETVERPKRVKHVIDRATESEKEENMMQIDEVVKTRGALEYQHLLALIGGFIKGSVETAKFEDEVRDLLGPDAFFIFTIEKLVLALQKQLSLIVSDTKSTEALTLLREYSLNDGGADGKVLSLAKFYNCTTTHLLHGDLACVQCKFFPGVLLSENETKEEEKLPFPSESIVKPTPKKKSIWKVPPRLGLAWVDEPPASRTFTRPLVGLAPLELHCGRKHLRLDHRVDFDPEVFFKAQTFTEGTSETLDAGMMRLALPIYKEIAIKETAEVRKAINDFAATQKVQDANSDKSKKKPDTWYAQLVHNTEAEASPAHRNGADDDVEMKNA